MPVSLSLGSVFPFFNPFRAMRSADGLTDPVLGPIGISHVQICPQNGPMVVNRDMIDSLRSLYHQTRFRLHANARLLEAGAVQFDLGSVCKHPEYHRALVDLLRFLGEPYTLHAAIGSSLPLAAQFEWCARLSDEAGVPVGIEGLYPGVPSSFTSWEDYASLLSSSVFYALDLSHLNIVREKTGEPPQDLLPALLSNPRCLEVHLSGNDGHRDSHAALEDADVWWLPFLSSVHPEAVVFYEGRFRSVH